MPTFQHINIPISLGNPEFSYVNAYFLGAILSANEPHSDNNKIIWLAPYRHNYGGLANDENIREHINYIKTLIKRCNGKILSKDTLVGKNWFPSNKQGFAVAFESPIDITIEDIITPLVDIIDTADEDVVRCFIVGAFDGRSSIDYDRSHNKARFLTLDCSNESVMTLLSKALSRLGFGEGNYNTSRDRLEGGLPRRNQFRISSDDVLLFVKNIGMICPSRFEKLKQIYTTLYEACNYNILNGLKTLSVVMPTDNNLDNITEYSSQTELQSDSILLDEINEQIIESLESDTDFEYARTPQIKKAPVFVNGHKTYKRDKKKSLNALTKANHKCEIDETHPSFIRKNSANNYMEPHHLVPMEFSDAFDVSLDVEENIVSLCSNCHNQLHYGRDIRDLLCSLFELRKDLLKSVGIELSLEELYDMYGA